MSIRNLFVPFPCKFFASKIWCGADLITRMEPILLNAWSPSYYTHGALKTGGGCRASIAHAWSRRVDVWTRVRVDVWTRVRVDMPTAPFWLFFFFRPIMQPLQNCIGPTICIGREIWCLPYAGFLVMTWTLCMPGEQWILGFIGPKKIMVTQYQHKAMIFYLTWKKLDILDFTLTHTHLGIWNVFKWLVWQIHEICSLATQF